VADLHEQKCVEMEKWKDPRAHRRRGESFGRDHLFFPETAGRWILYTAGTAAQSLAHQHVLSRVNVGMGAETPPSRIAELISQLSPGCPVRFS
jgi:hypothetical protein